MKKLLILLISIFCFSNTLTAQVLDPVSWQVTVEQEKDDSYNILMTATIEEGWHLYSQKQFGEEFEGPITTEFSYNNSDETFTLEGETLEPDVKPIHDPVFDLDVIFFEDKATFIQPIKVINPEGLKVKRRDLLFSV